MNLKSREFDSEPLENSLHKLTSIGAFFNTPGTSREEYHQHVAYPFDWKNMRTNWDSINQN